MDGGARHGGGGGDREVGGAGAGGDTAAASGDAAHTVVVQDAHITTLNREEMLQMSETSLKEMVVVSREVAPPPPSLHLPYGGYDRVDVRGRPVERTAKHPFALSRVFHDEAELPSEQEQVGGVATLAYYWPAWVHGSFGALLFRL